MSYELHIEKAPLLNELIENVEQYAIAIHQELHQYPEISLKEFRTMSRVKEELDKLGIKHEYVENGGIIGYLEGALPGKTIILRSDLDALPMQESKYNLKQEKEVVSTVDGVAHTCGHDAHIAMLLSSAKILSELKDEISGTIILAFEQGEEVGGGIHNLMKRLQEIGADGVWGIHLKNDLPAGKISVNEGPRMASVSAFDIKITGRGGHGSRPDLSISPIDCFVDIYSQLKSITSISLSPFESTTFSIGVLKSGDARNIIPETLEFGGTIRYLNMEQGQVVIDKMEKVLKAVCDIYNCTYEYNIKPQARDFVVYNDSISAQRAEQAVIKVLGEDALYPCPPWMGSESFGVYQRNFTGVFAFVGIQNEELGSGADHHNIHFDIDKSALKVGISATVQYAIDFLNESK